MGATLYFWGNQGEILVDIRTTRGIEIAAKIHFTDPDLLHEQQASEVYDRQKSQKGAPMFPDEDTWRANTNTHHSFQESACKFVSDAVEETVRGIVEEKRRGQVNLEYAGIPITCDIQCGGGSPQSL